MKLKKGKNIIENMVNNRIIQIPKKVHRPFLVSSCYKRYFTNCFSGIDTANHKYSPIQNGWDRVAYHKISDYDFIPAVLRNKP